MQDYILYNNKIKQRLDDGFYNIEADQIALDAYLSYIKTNSKLFVNLEAKLDYLIKEGYYQDFYQLYQKSDILQLYQALYDYHFRFQSFMAATKFYGSYALKTFDNKLYLENYEDRILACSLTLAKGDINLAKEFAFLLIRQEYQPATPTFLNTGRKMGGELISCFLLSCDDSLNSICYNLTTAMQLSKIGGGVALDLSRLRAQGEEIQKHQGVGRGVLPVMKLLEDAFNYVDQLGQRPGAGAVYLNIFHKDILEFLDTKKINADEKNRIQTLSIGILIPDKFMQLAKMDAEVSLFYPYSIYKEYGKYFDEIDFNIMYDELIHNPQILAIKIKARDLLQKIAITQFESGYPYMVFIDNANQKNPLKNIGRIKMSNLCTEIFQIQETSKINDYGENNDIKCDVSCNLGSLNIVNVMESDDFEKIIKLSMEALTSVSDQINLKNAPGINYGNQKYHAVGLGVMNLHGFLTKHKIAYESSLAQEFVDVFFATLNYYSLKSSMEIAISKQRSFDGFYESEYYNGNYFQMYLDNDFSPQSEQIKALFKNIKIPSKADWYLLSQQIKQHGLYHAYRLAIAPTQSISYIQNATASILPIVDLVETRMYKDSMTYYPMPFLSRDNILYYKSGYYMDQEKIIDLVSVIQKHVDQGISLVLYVTSEASTKDLVRLYYYAWKKGLKSLYYIRTKNLTLQECETCSI